MSVKMHELVREIPLEILLHPEVRERLPKTLSNVTRRAEDKEPISVETVVKLVHGLNTQSARIMKVINKQKIK